MKKIFHNIFRPLLLLAALLMLPASAAAAPLVKNADGIYIINTRDDLLELMGNESYWGQAFIQTSNIDLEGVAWKPIGYKTKPFHGHYDGQGHSITNLTVLWDRIVRTPAEGALAIGMFGYVENATIENLNIITAKITRTDQGNDLSLASTGFDTNLKIGVLCGAIGKKVVIRNIAIVRSKIDDGDKSAPSASPTSLFLGSVVGDMASGYGGTEKVEGSDVPNISCIFANVDIDIDKTQHIARTEEGSHYYQFNVGGIVGRIRNIGKEAIPSDVVYSGKIKAPISFVGPIFGAMRGGTASVNAKDLVSIYAGENPGEKTRIYSNKDEFDALNAGRYFYNYEIFYSPDVIINFKQVTDDWPSSNLNPAVDHLKNDRTRTMASHLGITGSLKEANAYQKLATMAWFQGVNIGTYSPSPDTNDDQKRVLLDLLNTNIRASYGEEPDFEFTYVTTRNCYRLSRKDKQLSDYRVEITTEPGGYYQAHLYNVIHTTIDAQAELPGHWQWYESADPTHFPFTTVAGDPSDPSKIKAGNMHYKVEWIPDNPSYPWRPLGFRGPFARIFVYDRAGTIAFKENFADRYPALTRFDTDTYNVEGDDTYDGLTPFTPVHTMSAAYARLLEDGDWDNNMIVVMGYLSDPNFLRKAVHPGIYTIPATISGEDTDITNGINGGILEIHNQAKVAGVGVANGLDLEAPLKLSALNLFYENYNITVDGKQYQSDYPLIYCNYYDFYVDRGVYMYNMGIMDGKTGLPADIRSQPRLTVVAGSFERGSTAPVMYPANNKEPDRVNLTLRSGVFGRVIGASRNASQTACQTTGTPAGPNRVKITIDIPGAGLNSSGDYENYSPYGFHTNSTPSGAIRYSHDIGLVVGGQTDGAVWADAEIEIIDGRIARLVGGNLAYGRAAHLSDPASHDSFFGRSKISIKGGKINEIYGASLGRHQQSGEQYTDKSEAYFYGTSEINISGGIIGKYQGNAKSGNNKVSDLLNDIEPSVYGAGAGGIMGLGSSIEGMLPGHEVTEDLPAAIISHTPDERIPYINSSDVLSYGNFSTAMAAGNTSPVLIVHKSIATDDKTDVRIWDKSQCSINVTGGTIEGSVYGAGYGYSNNMDVWRARPQVGNLYGDSHVNIATQPGGVPPTIKGSVHGSGAGARLFYDAAVAYNSKPENASNQLDLADYEAMAIQFGDSYVEVLGGVIEGDVFGAAQGEHGFPSMAAMFGSSHLRVGGTADVRGNVYGGASLADVRRVGDDESTGNTYVTIEGGTLGDCVFGGSYGAYLKDNVETVTEMSVRIDGDTHLNIEGGIFTTESTRMQPDGKDDKGKNVYTEVHKNFNIYGGGFYNSTVKGNTYLRIFRSLLGDINTIDLTKIPSMPAGLTPEEGFTYAWDDILFRRFCVYGGGYGEKARVVGRANVLIEIDAADQVINPESYTHRLYPHQMVFDVCGGGYTGDVGSTNLIIGGNSIVRKVIGGGFYGSVRGDTHAQVRSGLMHSVIGGCMMGYVYDKAHLTIGNRTDDGSSSADNATLWVLDNVYGANDVQGIVGIEPANLGDMVGEGEEKIEVTEELIADDPYNTAILYRANVDNPDKGVILNIYGGTIYGSVYGAGNGHYRGYYVPDWGRYIDGPQRFYRNVPARTEAIEAAGDLYPYRHRVYKTRPTVGRVTINVQGNNETDRVDIRESFFGGGRDCTIGQWNSRLQAGDPRRLTLDKSGLLEVNFGSHVTVGYHVHMGARGTLFGTQPTWDNYAADVKTVLDDTYNVVTTEQLDKVGEGAYYHWYYDGNDKCYKPGFPKLGEMFENPWGEWKGQVATEPDKSYFLTGLHQFYGYMKFIEMAADVKLHFTDTPYDSADDAEKGLFSSTLPTAPENMITHADEIGLSDIRFNSFFLGGEHGFMTHEPKSGVTPGATGHYYDYDITIPRGITILDKVVGGCEDSWMKYYEYSDDFSSFNTDNLLYDLNGGLTAQSSFVDPSLGLTREEESLPTTPLWIEEIDGKWYGRMVANSRHNKYAIRLNVTASFEPQLDEDLAVDPVTGAVDEAKRYGGLIFGGCYNSGRIDGNVVINTSSDLLGSVPIYNNNSENLGELSELKYNVGRVFGGGFGAETEIIGNTYVHLLKDFRGFNVFGGSMLGTINGSSNVVYIGTENSFVYGAIYGGSLLGDVGFSREVAAVGTPGDADYVPAHLATLEIGGHIDGDPANTATDNIFDGKATTIKLYSGNVDEVYGGSCLGDVYGSTDIYIADEVTEDLDYLVWSRLSTEGWGESRLVAGHVYGANDIAGRVITSNPIVNTWESDTKPDWKSVKIHLFEHPITEAPTPAPPMGKGGKDSPGSHGGYNGFPLVGYLYGGPNGNYGAPTDDGHYAAGSMVEMATGQKAASFTADLNTYTYKGRIFLKPHAEKVDILVNGGTVVNLFGGGRRSNVVESLDITVNYVDTIARAGFASREEAERMWAVFHLNQDNEQVQEVMRPVDITDPDADYVHLAQIFRLFGGNDNADMAIQPRWNLVKGHIGSVYSGGNIGRMTYFNPDFDPAAEDKYKRLPGLSLWIDQPDIRIDNVYGGARIGDIHALDNGATVIFTDADRYGAETEYYGATLNISDGIIESVYGGNDISGMVYNGTRVNISGAISGDVYCAGNGNYLYEYDRNNEYTSRPVTEIYEKATTAETLKGRRIVMLRQKPEYPATDPAMRLLAINSYRPNVSRSRLDVRGKAADPGVPGSKPTFVYVKGNVYCGGNSSTVSGGEGVHDIKFHIGSYVMLNGVFLGSNGEQLALGENIQSIEVLNDIGDITVANPLTDPAALSAEDKTAADTQLYPKLLSLYMRAVDNTALPKEFGFDDDLHDAYIGNFYIGGNSGSMLTDRSIHLSLPESLVVYGSIVGGCNNADVTYKGVTHRGGLTKPLAAGEGKYKVNLDVACRFMPLVLQYPTTHGELPISLHNYMLDEDGEPLYEEQEDGTFVLNTSYTGKKYYPDGMCNVYGGCNQSGHVEGGVQINMYSDMLDYGGTTFNAVTGAVTDGRVDKQAVINSIDKTWRTFDVFGGGFGSSTTVNGDINVRMLPTKASPFYDSATSPAHPSVGALFGGSKNGTVIGNTLVEVRDGTVLSNVYGGSETAKLYGSTNVMIGYPDYYTVTADGTGRYKILPVDDLPAFDKGADTRPDENHDGVEVIRSKVSYYEDDIVAANLYDRIDKAIKTGTDYEVLTADEKAARFTRVIYQPHDIAVEAGIAPITWNDIKIEIGDQHSLAHHAAPFFGHGNVYGGGFVPVNNEDASLNANYTVVPFDADYNHGDGTIGYGGNSNVMIWDNPRNADYDITHTADAPGSYTQEIGGTDYTVGLADHVSIGTGHYTAKAIAAGKSTMNTFKLEGGKYVHQPAGTAVEGAQYFDLSADGGVYGGGRKVYVQGYRAVDVAYYGYADHTPQDPKLLNTFQRADFVTVTDCSIRLHGASDFAGKVNVEPFSINRVGALMMVSSIVDDAALDPGTRVEAQNNNLNHNTLRSRNYVALFHNVNYLAALATNTSLGDNYHKIDGTTESGVTYLSYKKKLIDDYESVRDKETDPEDYKLKFRLRNVGTAANMLGINNGYHLHILGYYTKLKPGSTTEYDSGSYYGPVFGVAEIKMLTVTPDEGGGFVYARNHHFDSYDGAHTGTPQSTLGSQDFLHTTGNFVFPGAMKVAGSDEYNYVIDDCQPIDKGYYYLKSHYDGEAETFDVNEEEEVHYWYINGTRYFYNLTLTAYTGNTSLDPSHFYVDNDGLVVLAGLQPGKDIYVKSVTWEDEGTLDEDKGVYDVNRINEESSKYHLYFTVDNNTRIETMPKDNSGSAYAVEIPRANYDRNYPDTPVNGTLAEGSKWKVDPNTMKTDEVSGLISKYKETAEGAGNVPLLCVHLFDGSDNGSQNGEELTAPEYYQKYLDRPRNVQIVLTSTSHDEATDQDINYEYTINLTLRYLLGPDLKGHIVIENCALPGEYIYANSKDVELVIDESSADILSVSSRSWLLVPCKAEPKAASGTYEYYSPGDAEYKEYEINDMKLAGTDREVRIPAYYYMDGWKLRYCVTVNEQHLYADADFEHATDIEREETPAVISEPTPELAPEMTPETAPSIHDSPSQKKHVHSRLTVHNYHRMRPWDGSRKHDLRFSKGARIYIEDNDDLKEFFTYLASVQTATTHADETRFDLADYGYDINPVGADGLKFYQQRNVDIPTDVTWSGVKIEKFTGDYNGNGFIMNIFDKTNLPFYNQGRIYNLGFVSTSDEEDLSKNTVIESNEGGLMVNCYYYSTKEKGRLAHDGTLVNCYQNTPAKIYKEGEEPTDFPLDQLMKISSSHFHFGHVAYNLNGFYLKKRDLLLRAGAENTHASLDATDIAKREDDAYAVQYIEDMFRNGDYQYAYWRSGTTTGGQGDQFAEALRTAAMPNYLDMNNLRQAGKSPTAHNTDHTHDPLRWCDTHKRNHPVFKLDDYVFFGQDISAAGESSSLPTQFTPATRVYRASGFYGDKIDKGSFFNRNAYIGSPLVTAIDVTGFRDKQTEVIDEVTRLRGLGDAWDGWIITGLQQVFYPPTLDMPYTESLGFDVPTLTISDHVTRNLLMYSTDSDVLLDGLHYPDAYDLYTIVSDNDYALHDESTVRGHHIVWDATADEGAGKFRAYKGMLHVVDGEDMNVPIEFEATQAWYTREPKGYSNGTAEKTAWEGIFLPFTANRVYAASTAGVAVRDHGVLSHFYSDNAKTHEYWLRRLDATGASEGKLPFTRPKSDNVTANADSVAHYTYYNEYFHTAYGSYDYAEYGDNPDGSAGEDNYHDVYYKQKHEFDDYRFLTGYVPYIVTYPGVRYREFDMSGDFYADVHSDAASYAQRVCYLSSKKATLAVSDDLLHTLAATPPTNGAFRFLGTFKHLEAGDAADGTRLFAINEVPDDVDDPNEPPTATDGSKFIPLAEGAKIEPFRTYLVQTGYSTKPVKIATRGEEIELPVEPESVDEQADGIDIRVDNNVLVVTSPEATVLTLYDIAGHAMRVLDIAEGENRYHDLTPGFYMLLNTKVVIR